MKNEKLTVLSLFGVMLLAACGSSAVVSSETPSSDSSITTSTSEVSSEVSSEDPNADLPYANGLFNYAAESYGEREKILGQLEKYTLDNFLGGIPFADNAGNILYNHRLSIPSDVFIPNYGFGVAESTIMGPMTLEQEPEAKYQWYYHTWQNKDPGTINYWDGTDSVTADLYGQISSLYYNTRFTADKSSYEWYKSLATEMPIALNAADNGMATKWQIKVRTDAELKYRTLSEVPAVAAFNDRRVVLADYLTPFKMMLDHNLFRATDLGSTSSGFKGAGEYATAKADGRDPSWDDVGIQLNVAENAIEFEFNTAKTPFYAMYFLSTSLFSPVPSEFITAIGGIENYGQPNINSTLSLGMYVMEEWQTTKQVVFKKNSTYFAKDRAQFAGVKYTVLATATVAFAEFLAGKLDAATIPSANLQQYKTDPRRRQTLGNTVWKIQVNATTPERYEELFGEEGSVFPHAEGEYWPHKPVLANYNFLNGLYFAVNRVEIAALNGRRPAQAFLSDAYMIDPEQGISFRNSETSEWVLAERSPETMGYSIALATAYFQAAMTELEAAGKYAPGTPTTPTEIPLRINYQTQLQVDTEGQLMKNYFESVFNAACPNYKLIITPYATANWMDAYYAAMYGEFDLAFGSISGNTLDPINFMDTVMSDNRTGFTLSWGIDTNTPTQDIRYDGKAWSMAGLYGAANGGAVVKDGAETPLFTVGTPVVTAGTEVGKWNVVTSGTWYHELPDDVQVDIVQVGLYNGLTGAFTEFDVDDVVVFNPDGTFTITFTNVDLSTSAPGAGYYVDIYYTTTVAGLTSGVINVYPWFDVPTV